MSNTDATIPSGREYIISTVGPARIVRLFADEFQALPRQDRLLAYHLSRAAIAGRGIGFHQRHARGRDVLSLFEHLYQYSDRLDTSIAAAVSKYLHLLWINNGFYDNLTSRKFTPSFTISELSNALESLNAKGLPRLRDALDLLQELRGIIFDPSVDPVLTEKTPGHDCVKGSAVTFYDPLLDMAAVEQWSRVGLERHPLNAGVALRSGKIVEEIWRAGDRDHPAGTYAAELSNVITHLERAIPCASSAHQSGTIRLLIRFLRTGDADDFRNYNVHWIADTSTVDFILGFIEVYLDPRNRKGEWEASVFMTDRTKTALMSNIASQAEYFERRSPWAEQYKKQQNTIPVARVINVLAGTGGAGPISPIGINLPNEQALRQEFGSKSFLLENVTVSSNEANGSLLLHEFAFDATEISEEEKYGIRADMLHTALHEILGHGSGKVSPRLQGTDPAALLPGYYSTLEETRADLVALWHAWDPMLIELGAARDREELEAIARTMARQAIRGAITQLRRIGGARQLEEDHMKCRQFIALYVLQNSAGIEIVRRNGKTYHVISNFAAVHECVGRLLAEVMRIKAEGDLPAAKRLIDTYGLTVDVALRDEVRARVQPLNVSSYQAMVFPTIEAVIDNTGSPVDARLAYPRTLAEQMLGDYRSGPA